MLDNEVRFKDKFVVNEITGCWNWIACKCASSPRGKGKQVKWFYGYFSKRTDNGELRQVLAHRMAYELYKGVIPGGMELDHLCGNTLCVNPGHLEPVTHKENIRRGYALKPLVTHCKHGHEYDEKNTYWKKRAGGTMTRECRICRKAQLIAHYERY